jgi:hypothetical protein
VKQENEKTTQAASPPDPAKSAEATLIVFGQDDAGKPHASWFKAADAVVAGKAAGMMGMKILRLGEGEHHSFAGKLPQGRVFASGKAFVPFVNRTVYGQLEAMGGEIPSVDPAVIQTSHEEKPNSDSLNNAAEATARTVAPAAWSEIRVGSVVLMTEGRPKEGWWEAVVVEVKAGDLFVLGWRVFPEDERPLVRKREHLALLPPAATAEKA